MSDRPAPPPAPPPHIRRDLAGPLVPRRKLVGDWERVERALLRIAGGGELGSVDLAPTQAAALLYLLRYSAPPTPAREGDRG